MRKCIVLNIVDLTPKKSRLLRCVFSEYLKVPNKTLELLPKASSSNQLHHLTYSGIRETSLLPSDIIQEARKDIWVKRRKIKNKIASASIRLNKRWFKFVKTKRNNPCFKITYSPRQSLAIPVKKNRQFQRFNSFTSSGWVFDNISLLKDGKIAVILEKEFEKPKLLRRYALGIDIGSSVLASVSIFDIVKSKVIRQLYFGKDIALRQQRYSKRRAYLQSLADKGSERARKSLKRLKRKQENFVKTRSGQIAKGIVTLAQKYDACISIEKLKNMRGKKGKFNKKANTKINRIPYGKFREFLKSNCELFEIPFYEVDAYRTSKWCSHCGAVNNGHYSGNYSLYKCKECGLIVNSDRKASLAVAVKSVLERSSQRLNNLDFVQISNTKVPVNGFFRPDDVGLNVAVQHNNQLMESQPILGR
ncbi:hypothetical protein COT30_04110 [Candidatus Micrarchaeota archaeon CG08_land_8_20_14_0_20_49_17]|nr:MAG: hypothetical protein AUJ13_01540 [Candidatus Micrarchaeota archaeon CG1_02_49_24]PIU09494.1 MAG: hypothetical protein COT30_04110 [Candidatus Micrarchaeota archaeon CG08_land_8_20_14_0_20_49_17]PIU81243.1 MAG: hypothetical protein COS70_05105 [Candidatus Micrarchaeota archaeon CG06_land_8_20_14_3_00_50_6]PIZ92521.1 MAG: hypothetical protein COX84_06650 [Candidatus Micrarchaeota archaeon CG_4_10_14_0_2_um_filter_49_7]HII54203.1 IS200/IS605 family element transposase accessory protein Tnp